MKVKDLDQQLVQVLQTIRMRTPAGEDSVLLAARLKKAKGLMINGVLVIKAFLDRYSIDRNYFADTKVIGESTKIKEAKTKIAVLLPNERMANYYSAEWKNERDHTLPKVFRVVCDRAEKKGESLDFPHESNLIRGSDYLTIPAVNFSESLNAFSQMLTYTLNSFADRNVIGVRQLPILTFLSQDFHKEIFELEKQYPSFDGRAFREEFKKLETILLELGALKTRAHVSRAANHVSNFISDFQERPAFNSGCANAARNECGFPVLLLHSAY